MAGATSRSSLWCSTRICKHILVLRSSFAEPYRGSHASGPAKQKTRQKAGTLLGGEGGIRTLDRVASILHFECSALDRTMRPLLGT